MLDEMMLESTLLHMVRPQDLNHHGTLFAGQMASWLVEAGFIAAARMVGKPQDIVCAQLNEMAFKKPINLGDIIEIKSRIARLGSSSISVYSQVFRQQDQSHLVSNMATFVTVDKENKPYPHGLKLSPDYIEKNRAIYENAVNTKRSK